MRLIFTIEASLAMAIAFSLRLIVAPLQRFTIPPLVWLSVQCRDGVAAYERHAQWCRGRIL